MAIETICKGCARKLRVGDEFAGRKARCPHCKTVYTVPAGAAGLSSPQPAAGEAWLLRTSDGTEYGPVSRQELDDWVRDGRVDAAAQLRQQDESAWQPAAAVYPMLAATAAASQNPFSSEVTPTESAPNPYATPQVPTPAGRALRPHRGGMILVFGLIGFACCQIFSIVAWVMGHTDLKEINAGRMDPEGRGLTQAGMIIGIIGTVLMVVTIGFQMIMVLFMLVSG